MGLRLFSLPPSLPASPRPTAAAAAATTLLFRRRLSAALFMFCATFASTVALGDVAERETDGMVGITEYLMLQGIVQ